MTSVSNVHKLNTPETHHIKNGRLEQSKQATTYITGTLSWLSYITLVTVNSHAWLAWSMK